MKSQLVSTARISISNFTFEYAGELGYIVTFFSTKTNKSWICKTINSQLINATLKTTNPLQKDLIALKNLCKKRKYRECPHCDRIIPHPYNFNEHKQICKTIRQNHGN